MAKKSSRRCWLMKTEPHVFSIDDLVASPDQTTHWVGVRNYQARNLLRDDVQLGDDVLFYHSSCKQPAVVATAKIVRAAHADETAVDPASDYFDPKSSPENTRWYQVDIKLVKRFTTPVTITEMRSHEALAELPLLRKGNRLSVQQTTPEQFAYVVKLGSPK